MRISSSLRRKVLTRRGLSSSAFPKPPWFRWECGGILVTRMNGVEARSKMNCAILSPASMVIGDEDSFLRRIISSPLKSLVITPPLTVAPFRAMLCLSTILMYIPLGRTAERPVGM